MTLGRSFTIAPDGSSDDGGALEQLVRELRFNSPRRYADAGADDGADGTAGVMVSCASFSDKQRLELVLPGVRVLSRAGGVGDSATHTLVLAASGPQTSHFLGVDAVLQDHASALVERWFEGTDPGLVEDGYRASTIVRKGHGVCLRLLMATTDRRDGALPDGAGHGVTLTLRLVGMYFRRQSYSAIWRLMRCVPEGAGGEPEEHEGAAPEPTPSIPPPPPPPPPPPVTVRRDEGKGSTTAEEKAGTKAKARPRARAKARVGKYQFVSDSESESGAEEDDVALPTWDEFEAMREDVLQKLEDRRGAVQGVMDELAAEIARLGAAQNQDIAALEAAAARLGAS